MVSLSNHPPFGKKSLPASGGAEGDQGIGGILYINAVIIMRLLIYTYRISEECEETAKEL